jgi:integrase
MKQDPLGGETARAVFVKHIAVLIKRIPPLPDEVALPILNEADRWLRYRSDDIIRLHRYYMDLILKFSNEDEDGPVVLTADQADTVEPFEFSCEPGSNLPWHQPIEVIHRIHGIKRQRNFYTLDTLEVRGLVDALWGACVIVIQAESGMRPGEVVATPSGHDAERDEQVALLIEQSISGLHEIFYVKSLLGKTVDVPDRQKWVIGARPVGSHFLPGPYLAIKALERLLQPWRDMSGDKEVKDQLLIHQGNGSALPKKKRSISVATTTKLLSAQKLFIERHVDLSDLPDRSDLGENLCRYRETKGRCFIAQQWRKTYAMYTVRTDRRMIPDIAMQFKHLSVAMTESAYIGNDVSLMREVNSQQARQAAALMYRRIRGTAPTTGRLAKIIDEHREAINEIIGERSGTEAITHLAEWCEERGIKVFSSGQGKCAIGLYPSEARCHELAGTIHWSRKAPNFSYREPDVCNGCKCFGIDSDHVDFWENRYVENQTAYLKAKARGLTAGFLAIRERAQVSLRVCKALGRKVPTVRIS